MDITIYKASKKPKSTAIPTGGRRITGEIKHDSSIITPTFRFSPQAASDLTDYNMIYAGDFNRYYTINNWSYRAGFWEAECTCDVLASFKSTIGSTSMFCMRSANRWDGRVMDNLYPTFHASTVDTTAPSPWGQADRFILGVIGPADSSQAGSVTYYCMPPGALKDFMKYVLGQNRLVDDGQFQWGSLSTAIRAAIFNPIEYIVSCTYVPFQPSPLGALVTDIPYGWWSSSVANTNLLNATLTHTIPDITISLPHHPQMATKGIFVQNAPYSKFELQVNPFGVFPLDGSLIQDADHLRISIKVDLVTGLGIMEVFTVFQDNTERFLTRQTAQIGVPVQLSQESANLTAAFGAIGGGVQAASKASGGDYAGAVMAGLSAVGSAADLAQSAPSSIGANGARAGLSGLIRLHSTFYTIAAGDDVNEGRPLLEVLTPASIGGYMQFFNGTVPMVPGMTAEERDQINAFMESGFYYE